MKNMQRKRKVIRALLGACAASVLAISPVVSAEFISANYGDFILNGGDSYNTGGVMAPGALTMFTISFDYSEVVADASWASDLLVTFVDPSGDVFSIGGFDNETNPSWDFAGSGSTNDGFYSQTFDSSSPLWGTTFGEAGSYSLLATNDWGNDPNANTYSSFTVDYTFADPPSVPEPSMLALLTVGVIGLGVGLRRRRIR